MRLCMCACWCVLLVTPTSRVRAITSLICIRRLHLPCHPSANQCGVREQRASLPLSPSSHNQAGVTENRLQLDPTCCVTATCLRTLTNTLEKCKGTASHRFNGFGREFSNVEATQKPESTVSFLLADFFSPSVRLLDWSAAKKKKS